MAITKERREEIKKQLLQKMLEFARKELKICVVKHSIIVPVMCDTPELAVMGEKEQDKWIRDNFGVFRTIYSELKESILTNQIELEFEDRIRLYVCMGWPVKCDVLKEKLKGFAVFDENQKIEKLEMKDMIFHGCHDQLKKMRHVKKDKKEKKEEKESLVDGRETLMEKRDVDGENERGLSKKKVKKNGRIRVFDIGCEMLGTRPSRKFEKLTGTRDHEETEATKNDKKEEERLKTTQLAEEQRKKEEKMPMHSLLGTFASALKDPKWIEFEETKRLVDELFEDVLYWEQFHAVRWYAFVDENIQCVRMARIEGRTPSRKSIGSKTFVQGFTELVGLIETEASSSRSKLKELEKECSDKERCEIKDLESVWRKFLRTITKL